MSRYPDAEWVAGSKGDTFIGGAWRIVLHTTEGSSAAGAIGAYRQHNSWPHFTVAPHGVYQHVDTGLAARALKNPPGGVHTNRLHAIQIEIVGFAAKPKDAATLAHLRALLRWLEQKHGVPQRFPAGPLTWPAKSHRPVGVWAAEGGYYGHQQVPENDHVDPGVLTPADLGFNTAPVQEDDLTDDQAKQLARIATLVDDELEPWIAEMRQKTETQGRDLGKIKAALGIKDDD